MQTHALIAADPPAPPAPQIGGNLLDWGLAVAILLFIGKEALQFFKQKDADESALTKSLLEDQRETNKDLRTYLSKESSASAKIGDQLLQVEQRIMRHSAELIVDNRERLALLEKKVDALHSRLDTIVGRASESS